MYLYIIYVNFLRSGNLHRLGQYVDSKANDFLHSDDLWQDYMLCNWCQKQKPYTLPIKLLISILEIHII